MRFKTKVRAEDGDTRVIKKFAWYPKSVANVEHTWVWLEYYTSFQTFCCNCNEDDPDLFGDVIYATCDWFETKAHAIVDPSEQKEDTAEFLQEQTKDVTRL